MVHGISRVGVAGQGLKAAIAQRGTAGPRPNKGGIIILALLMALMFSPMASSSGDQSALKQSTRVVAATVNGVPIYEDEFEKEVQAVIRKNRKFGNTDSSEYRVKIQRGELNKHIQQELFEQASRKLDIPDIDKRVKDELGKLGKHSPAEEKEGSVDPALQKIMRQNIYLLEYLDKYGLSNPAVPEEEIKAVYENRRKSFASRAEKRQVRHIIIAVKEDASANEKESARKEIEKVRRLLVEGNAFEEVAKEYSQDDAAAKGGDLGFIARGFMPEKFDAVAFSMETGKLSDIIETALGFHVLEVLEIRPKGFVPSYEVMRPFLAKYLQEGLRTKKFAEHTQQLKEEADIQIFLSAPTDTPKPAEDRESTKTATQD